PDRVEPDRPVSQASPSSWAISSRTQNASRRVLPGGPRIRASLPKPHAVNEPKRFGDPSPTLYNGDDGLAHDAFERRFAAAVPDGGRTDRMSDDRKLAMFIDFENIVRGVKEAQYKAFEIRLVLERLVEKGKIMVKRAYADWSRYQEYKRPFHEHAIELIDVPQSRYSGKNSADIRMVVDAMDLAYAKQHVDTFALVSGDSDFSPLVSKLRENDRYVIGIGVKSSSSELLACNCHEFIFYDDLIRESKKTTAPRGLPEKKAEAFAQLIEAVLALQRENKDTLWGSMVKQTMIRKNPAFNESYYGYSTFSKLLEEAAKQRILTLEKDSKSGTYIITSLEEGRAACRATPRM